MAPGELVVLLLLICVVALAVRSLWKSRRSGGGCHGDCSTCGGCRCGQPEDTRK